MSWQKIQLEWSGLFFELSQSNVIYYGVQNLGGTSAHPAAGAADGSMARPTTTLQKKVYLLLLIV